ncbi:MAG TPA: iron-sulfur cluster assembly scaffold protein [Candidatus Nanopelagicaceae bacterium]|jgi:nitrogen fixation NifU-like protein|nr:iron-sulfur cluster assembly scaffold protein [Candidatus Nanopelagicaceae bacterium]
MPKDEEDFDKFVEKLQNEIIDNEMHDFNEHIVNLFHNPKNWGKPANFTLSHSCKGEKNDTMEFYLTIQDDIIKSANFFTDGCGATVATGSQTTILIEGKSLEYAESLKTEDINLALNGLPDDHKHSLELAVNTLRNLITKYKSKRN